MTKITPLLTLVKPGCIRYNAGLEMQKRLSSQPSEHSKDFHNVMLLLEHKPVYTIGIRSKGYTGEDENKLRQLGAEFYRTNRGGLITFHGPGQMVAYPVVHLKQFKPSMRWYVGALEQTVIETCRGLGVHEAKTTQDTGIWVGDKKICAIGVHGSRYITTHGIGLNCNTDLSWFDHIVPCGIEGKGVTSLSQELNRNVSVSEASEVFIKSFSRVFQCNIEESSERDLNQLLSSVQDNENIKVF